MLLFVLTTVITVTLNVQYLLDATIGAKNIFQFLSILLALGLVIRSDQFPRHLMAAFLVIAMFQPAFAILQYFLERHSLFVGDRISGTFGGLPGLPGGGAELTLFMLVQTAAVLALVQRKRMKWKTAFPLLVWFAIPLLLAHVKAVVFLLPVIFLVLYGSQLLRRPLVAGGGFLIVIMLAGATFYYQYRTAGEYSFDRYAPSSYSEFISDTLRYNISQDDVRGLNRIRAIQFWWEEHSGPGGAAAFFLGHGLGATRDSGISVGHLASDPRYAGRGIGVTTLPRLLWEVGVVGTILYAAVFVAALRASRRLRSHPALPEADQAYMTAAMAASVIFLFTFPYNHSLLTSQSFSAFAMFILGYIAFWEQRCPKGVVTLTVPAKHVAPDATVAGATTHMISAQSHPPSSANPVGPSDSAGMPIGVAVSRASERADDERSRAFAGHPEAGPDNNVVAARRNRISPLPRSHTRNRSMRSYRCCQQLNKCGQISRAGARHTELHSPDAHGSIRILEVSDFFRMRRTINPATAGTLAAFAVGPADVSAQAPPHLCLLERTPHTFLSGWCHRWSGPRQGAQECDYACADLSWRPPGHAGHADWCASRARPVVTWVPA
jgi:GNAT superfamily N-acetyltransferase